MAKLMDTILTPPQGAAPGPHPGLEDLARLAEGGLPADEREPLIAHLNRCHDCYITFSHTLSDLEQVRAREETWWTRNSKQLMAIAACLVLALFIGTGIYYGTGPADQPVMLAALELDAGLKELILESDGKGRLGDDLAARLVAELKKRKIELEEPKEVIMLASYMPSKSLFGPKEILKVKVEGGVVYLEVVEEDKK